MTDRHEMLRLLELTRIDPTTTASEASFDLITRLVQQTLAVPAVAITLIDRDTQYLRAQQGLDIASMPRCEAVCDIVVRSGKPLNIGDMQQDPRVANNPAVVGAAGLRAYAGAPLTTQAGYHLGALCALDTKPRDFSPEQMDVLSRFALLVTDLLELRAQADHDFLTKALNRRGFEDVLSREMARINRNGGPATLAMMDLDHFKSVNDTYGHAVGDEVLKALTAMVTTRLRSCDYLARLGGEEFALLLTNTTLDDALIAADRIRNAVADFRLDGFPDLSLTVSIGLVDLTKCDHDLGAIMHKVDTAVYDAKANGRNQTCIVTDGTAPATPRLRKVVG